MIMLMIILVILLILMLMMRMVKKMKFNDAVDDEIIMFSLNHSQKGAQLQPLQQPTAQQPKPKLPIHTEVQISKSHKSEKSQTAKYILR